MRRRDWPISSPLQQDLRLGEILLDERMTGEVPDVADDDDLLERHAAGDAGERRVPPVHAEDPAEDVDHEGAVRECLEDGLEVGSWIAAESADIGRVRPAPGFVAVRLLSHLAPSSLVDSSASRSHIYRVRYPIFGRHGYPIAGRGLPAQRPVTR